MPRKRVRVSDIAREAGVSTATVDRVIHSRPGVKRHTVDLIEDVVRRLEYSPGRNGTARPLENLQFDFVLPAGPNTFMNMLADAAGECAKSLAVDGVRVQLHRIEGFNPQALADRIREIGASTNGLAVVALENPMVREAVNDLVDKGVPVVTVVSDITTTRRFAYVGLDNRAAGRTAGYLMGRFSKRSQGNILMIAGSLGLNYRDHEEREMGFFRVLSEDFPGLRIAERLESQDDHEKAYRQTRDVLDREPDLLGIYNIGAGNRGIAEALQEKAMAKDVIFIGHELTTFSRQYLIDGVMDAIIDQAPAREAETALSMLCDYHSKSDKSATFKPIPIEIFVRENLL